MEGRKRKALKKKMLETTKSEEELRTDQRRAFKLGQEELGIFEDEFSVAV